MAPGRLCLLGCSEPASLSTQPQHPAWSPSDPLPKLSHHPVLSQDLSSALPLLWTLLRPCVSAVLVLCLSSQDLCIPRGVALAQESSQPWFHWDTALGKDPAGSPIYSMGTASPSESWLAADIQVDDAAETLHRPGGLMWPRVTQGPGSRCGSFHWLKTCALKVYTALESIWSLS